MHAIATTPGSADDVRPTESTSGRPFEPDTELLERIAAGEPVRALAREIGIVHTTLLHSLRRPEVASELSAIRQRQRAEQQSRRAEERRWEKELPRRAKEQEAWARELEKMDKLSGRDSADRLSTNDTVAAQIVAAGGGIQELIAATELPNRLAVYESIDPRFAQTARANDRSRPKDQLATGSGFEPDHGMIERRAGGESLRSLASDSDVSYSTLSRAFARPHVAKQVQAAKQSLRLEQERRAAEDAMVASVANHYAFKIMNVRCPVHNKRTYVSNRETLGGEIHLEVAVCCPEAEAELRRWLKTYRPVPSPNSVPPMER
jgi:lambda repressor-like predicted transcriptional regulator